ncbi:ankyrin repeat-containing domain protein [Tirmania nivea]|nr:ankyrin repeat-containing domain protein [Tirmania nivea]
MNGGVTIKLNVLASHLDGRGRYTCHWGSGTDMRLSSKTVASYCISGIFGLCQGFLSLFKSEVHIERREIENWLVRASEFGEPEIVQLLIDTADIDVSAPDSSGKTCPYYVYDSRHPEVAKLLIEGGANVSAATQDGSTPLHNASRNGYQTPLHNASLRGHQELAKLLIDRGANVSAGANDGTTPLHDVAGNGRLEVVNLLIDRGAHVSAARTDGSTPLHEATREGHKAVAELLIDRGANLSGSRRDRIVPLCYASPWGYQSTIANMLID